MTKTLTEQWRDGTLDGGYYYLKTKDCKIFTDHTNYAVGEKMYHWEFADYSNVKEVLAPVPSYDEYQDIIQQNVNQESAIETYIEDIKRLQEQLNDANDIIDFYFPKIKKIHSVCIEPLKLYRKKWGLK